MVRGKKKKPIALFLGIAALLAGTAFWLFAPSNSPSLPAPAPKFSSVGLVKTEDSAAQNEATNIAREYKEGAAAVGHARVFACDWQDASEPEIIVDSHHDTIDSWNQKRSEIAASLAKSKDPELLLAAALIGFDRKSKEHFAAMEKALAADPDNPLTLWVFLETCWRNPDETVCQDGRIEKRAVLADGGNGRLWGEIAGYRFLRGDTAGAFDALVKANAAPQFNGYFIEHVEMLERGYAAATNDAYRERIEGAIGITAALVSNFNPVFQGCKKKAAEAAEWLQACLEYGKRLERDGRTYLPTVIGIAIQKTMYEMSGNAKKKMEAVHRRRLIADIMSSMSSSDYLVLLRFDDKVLADYIAEWVTYGELRAMQFVLAEVVRLSQEPGYDPCKLKEAWKSATHY